MDLKSSIHNGCETKHIYPGFWDNLVAGKVQAGEISLQALKRESWEEACLIIDEKKRKLS